MPATDDYAAILKRSLPLIDVRAPAEFVGGAVPGAVNLPLLDDAERAAVGKAYKARGRDAAVALGHRLVDGETKAARLAAWRAFATDHPEAMVYCWRGGLRSEIVQRWLAASGIEVPRIAGGFKALRRFCLDIIAGSPARRFVLVGGRTGCGKTATVRRAAAHLDLEALANHRGSAFGGLPAPQPSPVAFENALAVALLKLDPAAPVVVEDESRTIGRLAIPEPLFDAMGRAPIALLVVPDDQRIDNIYQEYVVEATAPRKHLTNALAHIERRLGGSRYREIAALMGEAFAAVDRCESRELHREWIGRLLRYYYDPMYDYQLQGKAERIAVQGDGSQIEAYLADRR